MAGRTYPDATPTLRQPLAPVGPEVTSRFRPDPPDDTPKRLGPYELRARLGAGGMGVVYRAHDTSLDRPVALKLLRPDLAHCPQARARFLREARAAAAVKSDHVITSAEVYIGGIRVGCQCDSRPPTEAERAAFMASHNKHDGPVEPYVAARVSH